jgi:hypothetical protein
MGRIVDYSEYRDSRATSRFVPIVEFETNNQRIRFEDWVGRTRRRGTGDLTQGPLPARESLARHDRSRRPQLAAVGPVPRAGSALDTVRAHALARDSQDVKPRSHALI